LKIQSPGGRLGKEETTTYRNMSTQSIALDPRLGAVVSVHVDGMKRLVGAIEGLGISSECTRW
jgi:hypothetical protein